MPLPLLAAAGRAAIGVGMRASSAMIGGAGQSMFKVSSRGSGQMIAAVGRNITVGLGRVEWNADKAMKDINKETRRRVMKATNFLQNRTRQNISVAWRDGGEEKRYPPKKQGRKTKSNPRYGTSSKKGEYPRRDLGIMHRSVYMKVVQHGDEVEGRVGTKLDYAIIHELTERPWLSKTLVETRDEIARILKGG